MNLVFGIPSKRNNKEEKYSFPVITMLADRGKGTSKKFVLNRAAVEAMSLDSENSKISYFHCLNEDNMNIGIFNSTESDIPESLRINVTKGPKKSFSDKKFYKFLKETFNLDTSINNEFRIDLFDDEVTITNPVLEDLSRVTDLESAGYIFFVENMTTEEEYSSSSDIMYTERTSYSGSNDNDEVSDIYHSISPDISLVSKEATNVDFGTEGHHIL